MLRVFLVSCLCVVLLCTSCHPASKKNKASLSLNLYNDPPSFDPRTASDGTSMNVLLALGEGLTRMGKGFKPKLAQAKSIEISKDQLTYTFKLRKAFWSDGEPVVAEDFIYAWSSALSPTFASPFAYKLFVIKNAEQIKRGLLPPESLGAYAADAQTLVVELAYRAPYFLELMASPTFFPLPHQSQKLSLQNIQNGPFVIKSWDPGHTLILEKNPRYWKASRVHLDEISYMMIDDTLTEYYLFEKGELDWAGSPLSNLSMDVIPTLKSEKRLNTYPVAEVYKLKINTTNPLLSNCCIRKALSLAIDRRAIVEDLFDGQHVAATSYVPLPLGECACFSQLSYDPDEAKRLWKQGCEELGMTPETAPPLHLSYNTNREHYRVVQVVQQQWKEVLGLTVILDVNDWPSHLAKVNCLDYQIARCGGIGDFLDPYSYLIPFIEKDPEEGGGINETGWQNQNFASLLDQARAERDSEKRLFLLQQAEELLLEEMPVIPLYFITYAYVKKPWVKGVVLTPIGTMDLRFAKVKKKPFK